MTTTAEQATGTPAAGDAAPSGPATEVAPAPKMRRRPVLVAASVAAVCLGALLGALAWSSASTADRVVAVRESVPRGEIIQEGDLVAVSVGVAPGMQTVPAESLSSLVGQRAAYDLVAGGLVTKESVRSTLMPRTGESIVGVALLPGLMPGEPLVAGDRVRVVSTPGADGEIPEAGPVEIPATVAGLHPGAEDGKTVVSVLVPEGDAAELAARQATGRVVLVLDTRER